MKQYKPLHVVLCVFGGLYECVILPLCVCVCVCVQAYSAALQTQWQWVDQLCVCVEQHLKDNTSYFQVRQDVWFVFTL